MFHISIAGSGDGSTKNRDYSSISSYGQISDSPYLRLPEDVLNVPPINFPDLYKSNDSEIPKEVEIYNAITKKVIRKNIKYSNKLESIKYIKSVPSYEGLLPPNIILESSLAMTSETVFQSEDRERKSQTTSVVTTESIFLPDDRVRISPTTSYPWRTIVWLLIEHPNGEMASCSGAIIDNFHVLTAGHCVYLHDENGWAWDSWYNTIKVFPALDGDYAPYAYAWATNGRTYTGWTDSRDYRHDWAVLTLDRNIGSFTGWMGRMTASSSNYIYADALNTAGYPGDKPDGTMWYDGDYGRTADEYNHWYYMDTFSGQSGSPVWRYYNNERHILTVHAHGDDGSGSNWGTRLNQDKYDRIITWVNSDTAPTDKADLIDDGQDYSGFTPTTIKSGENFRVWNNVRNIGTLSSGGFYVSYYASTDTDITVSDYFIGSQYISSISPFSYKTSDRSDAFPSNIPGGTYWVGWIIDRTNSVPEFDDNNNKAYKDSYQLLVKKSSGELCSSDSECSSDYCEGSSSYSARCCSSAPTNDGWYGGGESGCGVWDDSISYYRDYYCTSTGSSSYETTQTKDCDNSDGWYDYGDSGPGCNQMDDPTAEHRDYYVTSNSNSCSYCNYETKDCDGSDGWYGGGNTQAATCGSLDNDDSSYKRDYYTTSSGGCTYTTSNCPSKDCDSSDGWYGGGNNAGCGDDPSSYWYDYYVTSNTDSCTYTISCSGTNLFDCDGSDICVSSCDGNNVVPYKDYYVLTNTKTCSFSTGSSENCLDKTSTNSDSGDSPLSYGNCYDYTGCSSGSCIGSDYYDSCVSSISLTEYYASGASCLSKAYSCSNFEVVATDSYGDDPTYIETCTGGKGAGCSSGAFSTTTGISGTDYCAGTCGTGIDSCYFVEYYPFDSTDSCSGLDTCASKIYSADTEENTCKTCKGDGYWNLGGEISNCCGDDSGEYKKTRECDGKACSSDNNDDACCNVNNKCVYNNVCYLNNHKDDVTGNGKKEQCVNGMWKEILCEANLDCDDGNKYTQDTCVSPGTYESYCKHENIACFDKTDCPEDGYVEGNICSNDDVYQAYRTYECKNPATVQSYCGYTDDLTLIEDCRSDSYSSNFCYDNDAYRDFTDRGCSNAECFETTTQQKVAECEIYNCENGQCKFSAGLIAYYPFTSDASDYSGNNNHGTNYGAVLDIGIIGSSYRFDNNDYVDFGKGPSLSGKIDFSIAAWIKTSAGKEQVIIQQRNGGYNGEYQLKIKADGKLSFWEYGDKSFGFNLNSIKKVNDGNWHHVVAKRDQTGGYLYIDGVLDLKVLKAPKNLNNAISVAIGRDIRDRARSFDGLIDDVRIYNRALSSQEILDLYEIGSTCQDGETKQCGTTDIGICEYGIQTCAGGKWQACVGNIEPSQEIECNGIDENCDGKDSCNLIAWYKFENNAQDSSGNNYHGTNFGATFSAGKIGQALNLDNSDYVNFGTNPSIKGKGAFTIAAWVKTSSNGVIIQQRNGGFNGEYQVQVKNGKTNFWEYGDLQYGFNINSIKTLNDNNWHHVVGVRESDGTGRIYIDGSLDSSQYKPPRTLANLIVYVGADMRDRKDYFSGLIDEVRIYNRALSGQEVLDLYNSGGGDVACNQNPDCGTDGYIGNPFCSNDDIYQKWRTYTCNNPGQPNAFCSSSDSDKKKQECGDDGCSNGQCIPGWSPYNGNEYRLVPGDFSTSQSTCQAFSGNTHLATVNDVAENMWLVDTFVVDRTLGIGYNDGQTEGNFVWTYGASSYTNWHSGEPNNLGDEDCVGFYEWYGVPDYTWNDLKCSLSIGYICEKEAGKVIAHYKFENNVQDSSGNNYHGTNNGATFSAGKVGQALSLDGNDYVEVPSSSGLDVGQDYSIALWINPSSLVTWQALFERGSSTYSRILLWLNNDEITIGTNSYWSSTNANLQVNNWYHIAAVHSGSTDTEKIYLNGNLISTATGKTSDSLNTGNLRIGRPSVYSSGYYYSGKIDEVYFYNKALSSQEVLNLYNGA